MADTQSTAQNALFVTSTSSLRYADRDIDSATGQPIASPTYLVDNNGNPITVANPLGVNASFSASSIAINDPTVTTQKAGVNAGGSLQVAGQGVSGTPAGGVVSIQGVAGGQAVPITGSISASNPSVGTDGSAIPTSSTLIGASDGTNLQQLLVESSSNKNLRIGVYNGANELAVDSSGRITLVPNQVVEIGDGTTPTQKLAIDASGRLTLVPNSSVNVAQIGGVAAGLDNTNEIKVSNYVKSSAAGDTALTLGQATMANSLPVTMASNQGALGSVTVSNANANGQTTMVNSAPVVIASNQSAVAIGVVSGTALVADQSNTELRVSLYGKNSTAGDTALLADSTGRTLIGVSTATLFTTAQNTVGSGNSGDLDVSKLREISIDITTTAQAGTNPTLQLFWERKGADGNYYALWQSASLTAASNTLSTSIGAGMAYNQSLGPTGRLRWVVGGTATPTWSFTPNIYGK